MCLLYRDSKKCQHNLKKKIDNFSLRIFCNVTYTKRAKRSVYRMPS